ncbi:MAG TPA: TOBE domain-containing protein [Sulfolobales archaeon]|nr:TOBE domain-containing protein [Sulfolobales archaeon]
MKELQRRLGITTILVTHNQADTFAVGDRIMVLKDGMIQQIGSPEDLYNSPENVFIANFIGDPPMNIHKLPIDHPVVKRLELSIDENYKEIFVGIRPDEAIAIESSEEGHLAGRISMVEYVGSRKYVKIDLDDGISLRILAGSNIDQGQRTVIRVKRLHIFTHEGKRIKTVTLA